MKNSEIRRLCRVGCFQQDMSDCGVACLVTLMRYFGTNISLEYGRELSGTNAQGTTMYGLLLASQSMGFKAEGYEMDMEHLSAQTNPVIVHVVLPNGLMHFMVFCKSSKGKVVIFDPARGESVMTSEEFEKIWTKKALFVCPTTEQKQKIKGENRILGFFASTSRNNKAVFCSLVLLSLIVAAMGMATSLFFQKLIDDFLPNETIGIVLCGVAIVTLLTLVKVGLSSIKQLLVVKQYKGIQQELVSQFLHKLFSLKMSFFESRKIGDLSARLSDIRRIQGIVSYVIGGNVFVDVFVVIVGMCFTGYYVWPIPFVVMVVLLVSVYYIYRSNNTIITRQREMMASYSKLESNFINTVKNVRMIKVNNMSDNVAMINSQYYGQYVDKTYASDCLQIKLSLFYGVVSAVLLCGTMLVCSVMYFNGNHITIGQFIAVTSIISIIAPSIINLSLLSISYNDAKIAFDRFFSTIDLPSEKAEGEPCPDVESIVVKELSFAYIGRRKIIDKFSASFEKGRINCIVGRSGSGKSTLCKLLEKSYAASDDSILINNAIPLNSVSVTDYRKHIGIISQNIEMCEGTVLENICMGMTGDLQEIYQRVLQTCQTYGLMPYFSMLSDGLGTVVGEAGVSLSGGEKQLVALTRLLVRNPEVLILDEPTSAMDTQLHNRVWNILSEISKTHLVIVVTQQAALLDNYSDRINYITFQ